MLCRLSVLAFCGALALSADVCRGLPTRPPAGSNYHDTPRQISFQLLVKVGGPAFRVTVHGHVFHPGNQPVHAGDIEVARCEDGRGLQILPIMTYQPIDFGATFAAADVNFDGYLDISVLAEYGGTFARQVWWLYDPASGKFMKTELTRELDRLGTNGYHLDRKKREFVAEGLLAGCPSLVTRYRVEGNHLIVVHKETGRQIIKDVPAGVPCTVTVSEMIDGKMRVTAVRRFVDGEPLK
jgi:hypothetical protein